MNTKIFRMQGRQINDVRRFMERFSPTDFLCQRELACGFVYQHMRDLAGWQNRYCCELMYNVLFNWKNWEDKPPRTPGDFFRANGPTGQMTPVDQKAVGAYHPDQAQAVLLAKLWKIAVQTELPDTEKLQLFYLLGAGYLLAGKTLEEAPLTSREAQNAFQRIKTEETAEEMVSFAGEGDIVLPAREEPYRILLAPEAAARLLESGEKRIAPRKLRAAAHKQGGTALPVKLELCRSPDDPEPEREEFFPGEYRYLNCVGEIPVYLHPVRVCNGDWQMVRRGDRLLLTQNGQERTSWSGADIVSFAPEPWGDGCIFVQADQLNSDHFTFYNMLAGILHRPGRVVEVEMRNTELLLLFDNGRVLTNSDREIRETISRLQDLL